VCINPILIIKDIAGTALGRHIIIKYNNLKVIGLCEDAEEPKKNTTIRIEGWL